MKTAFSEGLWSLAGRVAIGGGVFIALAWLLAPEIRGLLQNGAIVTTDFQVAAWLHAASAPSFIAFMRWVSVFHGIASILCMTVIAAAALWWYGEQEKLPTLMAIVPVGMLINVAVKFAVRRDRPDWGYGLGTLETFSFPSGHTEGATLFYGAIVVWLWPRIRTAWMRLALLIAAMSLVLLVAASRIVLGLHFLSDCVAAVLEALVWLAICFLAARPAGRSANPVHKEP